MCTGLEIAAMAAGGIGQAIQANQVQKQQDAVVSASNDRLNQFLDRNKQREQQAADLFASRQQAAEADQAAQTRDEAVQSREQKTTEAIDTTAPATAAPIQGSAASIIGKVYDNESKKATDAAKTRASALAKTSGMTDALFGQDLANTTVGRKLATIGEFASSDAGMLPMYQDLAAGAASARNRPSGIGSLLSGLGTMGGYYAGGRPAAPPRIS